MKGKHIFIIGVLVVLLALSATSVSAYCNDQYNSSLWLINSTISCSNEEINVTGRFLIVAGAGSVEASSFADPDALSSAAAYDLRSNSGEIPDSSATLDRLPNDSGYTAEWVQDAIPNSTAYFRMNESEHKLQLLVNVSSNTSMFYALDVDGNSSNGISIGNGFNADVAVGNVAAFGIIGVLVSNQSNTIDFGGGPTPGWLTQVSDGQSIDTSNSDWQFNATFHHNISSDNNVMEVIIDMGDFGPWLDKAVVYKHTDGDAAYFTTFTNNVLQEAEFGNLTLTNVSLNLFDNASVVSGTSLIVENSNITFHLDAGTNDTNFLSFNDSAYVFFNNSRIESNATAYRFGFEFFFMTANRRVEMHNTFFNNLCQWCGSYSSANGLTYTQSSGYALFNNLTAGSDFEDAIFRASSGSSNYIIQNSNFTESSGNIETGGSNISVLKNVMNSLFVWYSSGGIVQENVIGYMGGGALQVGEAQNVVFLNNTLDVEGITEFNASRTNTIVYNNSFGEIKWVLGNLTAGGGGSVDLNLGTSINITQNDIEANLLPSIYFHMANNSKIKFYNLAWQTGTAQLYKDGSRCDNQDFCNITYDASTGTLNATLAGLTLFSPGQYNTTGSASIPESVGNLSNQSSGSNWIYWNWSNPGGSFSEAIITLGGVNIINTSNNFINTTGLSPSTNYTLTVHTKNSGGGVNDTDVNSTAMTQQGQTYCGGAYTEGQTSTWVINSTVTCANEEIPLTAPISVVDNSQILRETFSFSSDSKAGYDLSNNESSITAAIPDLSKATPSGYTDNWITEDSHEFFITKDPTEHRVQLFVNSSNHVNYIYYIDLDDSTTSGCQSSGGACSSSTLGADFVFGYLGGSGFTGGTILAINTSNDFIIATSSGTSSSGIFSINTSTIPELTQNYTIYYNQTNISSGNFIELVIDATGPWQNKKVYSSDVEGTVKVTEFTNTTLSTDTTGVGNFSLINSSVFVRGDQKGDLNISFGADTYINIDGSNITYLLNSSSNNSLELSVVSPTSTVFNNSNISAMGVGAQYAFYVTDIAASDTFVMQDSFFDGICVNCGTDNNNGGGLIVKDSTGLTFDNISYGNNFQNRPASIAMTNSIFTRSTLGLVWNELQFSDVATNNTISNNRFDWSVDMGSLSNSTIENNHFNVSLTLSSFGTNTMGNLLLNNNFSTARIDTGNMTGNNTFKYNNSFGSIVWNISNVSTSANLINISLGVFPIIENNSVNYVSTQTGIGKFNSTATISIANLGYTSQPLLLKDGSRCDDTDNCNITSYANGVLTAVVTEMGNYSTQNSPLFSFNLTIKYTNNTLADGATLRLLQYEQMDGPPTYVQTLTNTTSANGIGLITGVNSSNDLIYKLEVIKNVSGSITHVSPTLDYLGVDLFQTGFNGATIFLDQAITTNITVYDGQDANSLMGLGYDLIDTNSGNQIDFAESQTQTSIVKYLPINGTYSFSLHPNATAPLTATYAPNGCLNSTGVSAGDTVHCSINGTVQFLTISGYVSSSFSGYDTFGGVNYIIDAGNRVFADAALRNIGTFGGGDNDTYNPSTGFFNITVPATQTGTEMLINILARNDTTNLGAIYNITKSLGDSNTQVNLTLVPLYGSFGSFNVTDIQGQTVTPFTNITTINVTSAVTGDAINGLFTEFTVTYPNTKRILWSFAPSETTSLISLPILNGSTLDVEVFGPGSAPIKQTYNKTTLDSASRFDIQLRGFERRLPNGTVDRSDTKMEIFNYYNDSCNVPNPSSGCNLLTFEDFSTAE